MINTYIHAQEHDFHNERNHSRENAVTHAPQQCCYTHNTEEGNIRHLHGDAKVIPFVSAFILNNDINTRK